jgi:hypothetical protein
MRDRGAARRADALAARLGSALALADRGDSRDRRRARRRRNHPARQSHRRRTPRLAGRRARRPPTCRSSNAPCCSDDPDGTFEAVWMTRDGREVPVEVVRRHLRFGGREGFLSVARDVGARQGSPASARNSSRCSPTTSGIARHRARFRGAPGRGRPVEHGAEGSRGAHPDERRHRAHAGRELPHAPDRDRPTRSGAPSRSISPR